MSTSTWNVIHVDLAKIANNKRFASDSTPYTECRKAEIGAIMLNSIERLPKQQRDVILLYYYGELRMWQIGKVIGVGGPRVCQIHSAALINLQKILPLKPEDVYA